MKEDWLIELERIPDSIRVQESKLYTRKWFDYRDLLPIQATQEFADCYVRVYKDYYAKTRDLGMSDSVQHALDTNNVRHSQSLNVLTKARQCADIIGCKYDFYLRFAFERFLHRAWRYLPRPNQLYSEELVLDARDHWSLTKKTSLQLAEKERFLVVNYTGHPDQDAYHAYLIEQVRSREHPEMSLGRVLFREKQLPVDIAESNFGRDVIERSIYFYG